MMSLTKNNENAYCLAKIGADTAENEQHFAENLPKIGNHLLAEGPWTLFLGVLGDRDPETLPT